MLSNILSRNSSQTDKQYRELNIDGILNECYIYIESLNISPFLVRDKIAWQKEFCGYIDFTSMKPEDRNKLLITEIRPLNSRKTGKLWRYAFKTMSICTGKESEVLVDPKVFNRQPINKLDVIFVENSDLLKETWGDRKSWILKNYKIVIM